MRKYLKYDKIVEMLNDGWEIETDRGFGSTPYTPLFFLLYKDKCCGGEIHHQTIEKLIRKGVIRGRDVTVEYGRYQLIKPLPK